MSSLDYRRVREDFPILDQQIRGRRLVFLDSAASSQKPRQVIEAVSRFYERDNANVHRGAYTLAERATAAFEGARTRVAGFLGAPAPECVVWTRNATEAVNLVANSWGQANIREGDEILLSVMEHHANLIPWQMLAQRTGAVLRFLQLREDFTLDLESLDQVLTSRTRLVAVSHMSNVLGTINPVRQLADAAHAVGARILLDAAQSAPHLPTNVQDLDCDFLVFSGHKMLGPTGVGGLYGRREILDSMPPFLGGGEMISMVELERSTYKAAPHRFEAGTPAIAEAVGLGAAVDYLESLGMENVQAHEEEITAYALGVLDRIPGLRILGPRTARGGSISFVLEGVHPHDLATILDSEGVAIRAGHHCTMPLHDYLKVPASARASFYVYNGPEDADALGAALEKARSIFGLENQGV